MDSDFSCNACFLSFKQGDRAVATACHHLFCFDCTKRMLTTDSSCVVCQSVVTKSSIKAISVQNDPQDNSFKNMLMGQHPASVMSAALSGVQQYVQQQQIYSQRRIDHLEGKAMKMAEQCRQKLGDLHKAFETAKKKYQELKGQKQMLEADNQELQEKYASKAMEAKKLRENVQLLMNDKDELQRNYEQLARRAGVTPTALNNNNSNSNNHRNNVHGSGDGYHVNKMPRLGPGPGSGGHPKGPGGGTGGYYNGGGGAGGMGAGGGLGGQGQQYSGRSGAQYSGGAQRGRTMPPAPSPLASPQYNPATALCFDFHTPTVPQVPRAGVDAFGSGGSLGQQHRVHQHPTLKRSYPGSAGVLGGGAGTGMGGRRTPQGYRNGPGSGGGNSAGRGGGLSALGMSGLNQEGDGLSSLFDGL